MSPVDDPILQNGEECGASGGDLGYFPLALSFQDDFVGHGCVVGPYLGNDANVVSIHFSRTSD